MISQLAELIHNFAGIRVAVVGDVMLDSYLDGAAERICREAPVPVVSVQGRLDQPGGAANTAANLAALGAQVELLGVVGDDVQAGWLRAALAERGVSDGRLIVEPGRATLAKTRVSADDHLLLRFDHGDARPLSAAGAAALRERLARAFARCDALVISDYAYGVIGAATIAQIAALQAGSPRVIVADSKRLRDYAGVGITAAKPNYDEATHLLGPRKLRGGEGRAAAMASVGAALLDSLGARMVAVTLDAEGALLFEAGCPPYRTYATPAPPAHAAGAGDTFVSALALALAAGASGPAAAELAAAAAAVVVSRPGTIICGQADLREQIAAAGVYCLSRERLAERLAAWRAQGRRIAFTNGCFDIIHHGHIHLLNQAKAQADLLVVGVNSDAGVRRLKGPGRPVNSLDDRAQVLAALSSVDCVVAFDDDTPAELIAQIRPDVFVKGGDYTRAQLPEAGLVESLGGRVVLVPHLADRSTSDVIARIRAAPRARSVGGG